MLSMTSHMRSPRLRLVYTMLTVICVSTRQHAGADALAFTLPKPIQREDIKFISWWLQLSEAQTLAFDAMLARHQDDRSRVFDERIARIRQLAEVGGTLVLRGYPPECVQACEQFFAAQDEYLEAMKATDAEVFAEFQQLLSEAQLLLFNHVELWRERRRCLMSGWDLRGAAIDLEQFALTVLPQSDPAVLECVRPVLLDYANSVTRKFTEIDHAATRRMLDGVRIFADPSIAPQDRAKAIGSKHASVARRELGLADLNRRFAKALADSLPSPLGRAFLDAFNEQTLQLSHPDLPVSQAYTEAVFASPLLTLEQRTDLELKWRAQQTALDQITAAMVERELKWYEQVAITRSMQDATEFAEFMRIKRTQRWSLHRDYLQMLADTYASAISSEQVSAIRGSINDIALLLFQSKDDGYPLTRSLSRMRAAPAQTVP